MNALNKLKKLGIGTVQFGAKYGISNTFSRPNYKEVNNILKLATRNNILTLRIFILLCKVQRKGNNF